MAGELKLESNNVDILPCKRVGKDYVKRSVTTDKWPVHVEIRQHPNSLLDKNAVVSLVKEVIFSLPVLKNDYFITHKSLPENVQKEVDTIAIYLPSDVDKMKLSLANADIVYHNYAFLSDCSEALDLEADDLDVDAASCWHLPTVEFDGLWESLIFEEDIKSKLLRYINSTLLFFEHGVSSKLLPWNKVIFLHGPPGTGKTSLCKALAQKICVRFSDKYDCAHFIEIHSHNLFSKWFSESGKLVSKLFESILTLVADPQALVMLLIDEVETLAHCRKASIQGCNEPSDGIRVVNALLTHLDKIKCYPNVLIMTTSNITEAVDMALVDRADIKQFIGLPCKDAIYAIYVSCLQELQRAGIIQSETFGDFSELCPELDRITSRSVGLSGRTIRKLPLITHALYFEGRSIPLSRFLDALYLAVEQQWEDREILDIQQSNGVKLESSQEF